MPSLQTDPGSVCRLTNVNPQQSNACLHFVQICEVGDLKGDNSAERCPCAAPTIHFTELFLPTH